MYKEKIVIWGTARRAAMYSQWLLTHFDVIAYVSINAIAGMIYGIPVITPSEVEAAKPDAIVICVEIPQVENIRNEIECVSPRLLNVCKTIDEVVDTYDGDYLSFVNKRQIAVIKELLVASNDEISDYAWMYQRIIEYGVFCFYEERWLEEEYFWTVYGLQQIPEEFASFCNHISTLTVNTAAEVGVYRGRSAYFMCAILARKNPNFTYKMIDLYDRLDDFEMFHDILPQLEKCIPATSDDFKDEEYDYVFIDADHSYDASMKDFENMGLRAKQLVAFHDIYAHEYDCENGGTVRTWREVLERTSDKEYHVFSKYPDRWMGIGCIEMDGGI